MTRVFSAIYEKRGRWYVAYVDELPGVNTQGRTLAEARRNLKEALFLMLDTNRILARSQARGNTLIREIIKVAA